MLKLFKNVLIGLAQKLLLLGPILFSIISQGQTVDRALWDKIDSIRLQSSNIVHSNQDSAQRLMDLAFSMVEEPLDTLVYSSLLMSKGFDLQEVGEYASATKYYLEALDLCRKKNDSLKLSHALASMANLNYYLNDYEKCRQFVRESIKILERIDGGPGNLAHRYNVLALTYFDQDELDSALHYFMIGLSFLKQAEEVTPSNYTVYYGNIGQCLEETNQLYEADQYYRKSLGISIDKEWNDDILWTFNRMINNFMRMEKWDSARKYISWSKRYLPESVDLDVQKDLLNTEASYYIKEYNEDSLSIKLLQYGELSEELIEARTEANIQEMTAKYDLERKEANLAMERERSARYEEESKNQRILLFIAVIALILLSVAIVFLRNYYHQRRKMSLLELEIKDNKLDELMSAQESKTYAAMLKGQQQERERIARDLHDRLGGTLAALKHSLRSPENKIKEEDLEIVDQAVKEVRDVSHNLASSQFAEFGLTEALSQLKQTIEKVGEVHFDVYLHPSTSKLDQKVTIELYRIVQELLSNTLKHANANQISVQTNIVEGVFNLIYEDNGVGFDLAKAKRGMGLDNMRARVRRLNGVLNIDTEIGRGTIVIVELNQRS